MNKTLTLGLLSATLLTGVPAFANDYALPRTSCEELAGNRTGDEKKAFKDKCEQERFVNRTASPSEVRQDAKRKQCESKALAENKKDSKAFMEACMKSK